MKKIIIIFMVFICLISNIKIVKGFKVDLEIYPDIGQSDTNINLYVSTDPYRTSTQSFLYVFWDEKNIIQRKGDTYIKSINKYEHNWELIIKAPTTEKRYSSKGEHTIEVWVKNSTGFTVKKHTHFEITKQIPIPLWWEELLKNKKFLDKVKGEKGDRGEPGIKGDQGIQGEQGLQGEQGDIGEKGEPGLKGDQGIQGEQGLKGDKGDPGKSYPKFTFNLFCFMCFLSFLISIFALGDRLKRE